MLPEIIAYLKSLGVPAEPVQVTVTARGDYTRSRPSSAFVLANAMDFVPGVAPYTTTTVVELSAAPGGG